MRRSRPGPFQGASRSGRATSVSPAKEPRIQSAWSLTAATVVGAIAVLAFIAITQLAHLLDRSHHALSRAETKSHIQAELKKLLRRIGDIQAVSPRQLTRCFADRNDVARRNPFRVAHLRLKLFDNGLRQFGPEQKITQMLKEMRMRVDIGAGASIPFKRPLREPLTRPVR